MGQLRVALRQLGAAGGLSGEGTAMNSRLIGQLEEVRRNFCRFKKLTVLRECFFSLIEWVG